MKSHDSFVHKIMLKHLKPAIFFSAGVLEVIDISSNNNAFTMVKLKLHIETGFDRAGTRREGAPIYVLRRRYSAEVVAGCNNALRYGEPDSDGSLRKPFADRQ
jgi:hypothetical protein